MQHEPNLGTMMTCQMCGKSFWCEDGIPICSRQCDDDYEATYYCSQCGDEKDPDHDCCIKCTCDCCGEMKSPTEHYCSDECRKEMEDL